MNTDSTCVWVSVTVWTLCLIDLWLLEHPDERAGVHNCEDNRSSVFFQAGEQWSSAVKYGYRKQKTGFEKKPGNI